MRLGALFLGIFTLGSTKRNTFRRVNSQCVASFWSAANRASSKLQSKQRQLLRMRMSPQSCQKTYFAKLSTYTLEFIYSGGSCNVIISRTQQIRIVWMTLFQVVWCWIKSNSNPWASNALTRWELPRCKSEPSALILEQEHPFKGRLPGVKSSRSQAPHLVDIK